MTRFAFKHLGRDVIRRSTDCALLLAVEIELGGQAEVAQLDLHLVVEEQVAQLQISMDDSVLVQVLQSMDNLSRWKKLYFEKLNIFTKTLFIVLPLNCSMSSL